MKFVLIGPTYPFRGGIAHYTTLLFQALNQENEVLFCSFKRQYPRWLFPGKTDRETGQRLLDTGAQYILDPLNPFTWWQTVQHIREWKPEIVIMQWWIPFWAPAWLTLTALLRQQTESKIIYLCHNIFPHESTPLDKWVAKTVLRAGQGFVVHSEVEKAKLLALSPTARIEVNPLPTYQSFRQGTKTAEDARALLGIGREESVALFFGFIRPYKGLDILLEAMAHLPASLFVKLLVVGESWLPEAQIRNQVTHHGLGDRVTIINQYVPNEAVQCYFLAADVVILPYRQATQSAVVQMAFGFERPVITTRVGGLPEIVCDGVTGYIVPPDDSLSLTKAIEKFFQLNTEERQVMHDQIRSEADKFAWSHMVAALKRVAEAP